jgi:sulfatase modifying factor 1
MPELPASGSHRALRRVLVAKAVAGIALTVAFGGGWWLRAHGLSLAEYQNELRRGDEPRFDWRSVDKRHWQALVDNAPAAEEAPALTDAREKSSAGCATGMVRVKGNFRLELHGEATGEIERLQDGACTDWISKEFPARCRTFDRARIDEEVAKLPTRPLDFCMDRFEYPNVLGQNPVVVVTFHEAEALCKKSQKRLCNENEGTFACEGEEARPYPYGYTRDATACVVDRSWRPFAEGALQPRDGAGARAELDRLWQAEPSGARGACKSPFGVYDMTGNVDEWTRSARSTGFSSILKGGYWGPVRARCRPATRAHNEDFIAYQQGFRCCGEADAAVPAPRPQLSTSTSLASRSAPAAPAAPAADLSTEWDHRASDDADEVESIGRARVGLACVASRARTAPGQAPGVVAPAALLAAALVTTLARRRARRPC